MRSGAECRPHNSHKDQLNSPTAFFEKAYRAFLQAEGASAERIQRDYHIAGSNVRIRFAGPAMATWATPALDHLAVESNSGAALTICLWDSVSTGVRMPPPPWSRQDYIARAEVRHYNDARIRTAFHQGSRILHMLDMDLDLALIWKRDASRTPYHESAAPLRPILHWWMRDHGRQLVHAGAVGTEQGGVLLAGKGGMGKSTATLACLESDLYYAGDDYCLVSLNPHPFVYCLYSSAKLAEDSLSKLSYLGGATEETFKLESQKALIFLHQHLPEKIAHGFPIRGIFLPWISERGETRLEAASPAQALKALAPSTLFQLSGAGSRDFMTLVELVKLVPSYSLELGRDLGEVRQVIEGYLYTG